MRDLQIHLTVLFDKRCRGGGGLLVFFTSKVKGKNDGSPLS